MENTVTLTLKEYENLKSNADKYKNIEREFIELVYREAHTIFVKFLYNLEKANGPVKIRLNNELIDDLDLFDLRKDYIIIKTTYYEEYDRFNYKDKIVFVFDIKQTDTVNKFKNLLKKTNRNEKI